YEGRAAHRCQCAASSYVPRRNSAYPRRACERRDRPLCLRPQSRRRRIFLQVTKGAFRFATGRIKEMQDSKIAASTPLADIGVRGTEFWGGQLDKYGVLLLEGKVTVSNQAGSVMLG